MSAISFHSFSLSTSQVGRMLASSKAEATTLTGFYAFLEFIGERLGCAFDSVQAKKTELEGLWNQLHTTDTKSIPNNDVEKIATFIKMRELINTKDNIKSHLPFQITTERKSGFVSKVRFIIDNKTILETTLSMIGEDTIACMREKAHIWPDGTLSPSPDLNKNHINIIEKLAEVKQQQDQLKQDLSNLVNQRINLDSLINSANTLQVNRQIVEKMEQIIAISSGDSRTLKDCMNLIISLADKAKDTGFKFKNYKDASIDFEKIPGFEKTGILTTLSNGRVGLAQSLYCRGKLDKRFCKENESKEFIKQKLEYLKNFLTSAEFDSFQKMYFHLFRSYLWQFLNIMAPLCNGDRIRITFMGTHPDVLEVCLQKALDDLKGQRITLDTETIEVVRKLSLDPAYRW